MQPVTGESNNKVKVKTTIVVLITMVALVGIFIFVYSKMTSSEIVNLRTGDSANSTAESVDTVEEVPVSPSRLEFLIKDNKSDQAQVAIVKSVQISNTDAFNLYVYASSLFQIGNKEQAAFIFYLAQIRTRAYAHLDPDKSGAPALRASLNDTVGASINPWVGSDFDAWKKIAIKAIVYDKKIGYPTKPEFLESDETWKEKVDLERNAYENELMNFFSSTKRGDFEKSRKENNLYVGPWENPGPALPDVWK
jgi:hypothetical protein